MSQNTYEAAKASLPAARSLRPSREEELLQAIKTSVAEIKRQRDEALALLAIAQYDSDAQLNAGWLPRLQALRQAARASG